MATNTVHIQYIDRANDQYQRRHFNGEKHAHACTRLFVSVLSMCWCSDRERAAAGILFWFVSIASHEEKACHAFRQGAVREIRRLCCRRECVRALCLTLNYYAIAYTCVLTMWTKIFSCFTTNDRARVRVWVWASLTLAVWLYVRGQSNKSERAFSNSPQK